MPWFDRHRRYRDQLSVYLDGELDAAARERLERHLDGCDACRAEVDGLRVTAAALRDMPSPVARRSFTLTPEQVARPRRPSPLAARPLDFGMRIAAAGVAVALAAVVIVDAGGLTGDGTDGADRAPAESQEGGTGRVTQSNDQMYGDTEPEAAVTPTDLDAPVPSGDGAGGAGGPATGGGTPAASPVAEPAGGGTEPDTGDDTAGSGELRDRATPTPTAETPRSADGAEEPADDGTGAAETNALSAPSDGDGIGALTVVEIALGVALAVLVAASLGLAYARRRA